jgi:hypothetical protein
VVDLEMQQQPLVDDAVDEDDEVPVAVWVEDVGAGRRRRLDGRERLTDVVWTEDDAKGRSDGAAREKSKDGSRSSSGRHQTPESPLVPLGCRLVVMSPAVVAVVTDRRDGRGERCEWHAAMAVGLLPDLDPMNMAARLGIEVDGLRRRLRVEVAGDASDGRCRRRGDLLRDDALTKQVHDDGDEGGGCRPDAEA